MFVNLIGLAFVCMRMVVDVSLKSFAGSKTLHMISCGLALSFKIDVLYFLEVVQPEGQCDQCDHYAGQHFAVKLKLL